MLKCIRRHGALAAAHMALWHLHAIWHDTSNVCACEVCNTCLLAAVQRMRLSPPASPPGGMVAAAVAGSLAPAAAGVAAAASAVHGLWSEPSFAPAGTGAASGQPPGFNGAVVGPNPFGSDAQPPPNPFAAPGVQRTSPPNPFASISAMERQQSAASQASMSPQVPPAHAQPLVSVSQCTQLHRWSCSNGLRGPWALPRARLPAALLEHAVLCTSL